jgi:predicted alpha/beta-fold hydrolase
MSICSFSVMWSYLTNNSQTLFILIPSTIAIAGLLWRIVKRYPSTIIMQLTKENNFLINQCPSLAEYRPTPWLFNGHLMTVFGVIFRPLPQLSFERILLTVDSTGGTVAIDWHTRPYQHQPILLILHGLTGGSDNEYIRWMTLFASSKFNLCCVVTHARGCGRSKLTSPKSFCAANTDDVRETLKYIRSIVGEETPIFAVGYSLGAGILTKFLGEEGNQCSLQGAIVCCASFDMHLSSNRLEQWLNIRMYNRRLTNNLIRYLRQHEEHFSKTESNSNLNLNNAYQSRTIRDFDKHVVVPQYGFRDVEHYYSEASSNKWLKYIRIPTLILSAIDDPICPIDGLPIEDVLQNSNIITVKTKEGGHVSYLQGWWPRSFSYDNFVVTDYIQARLKQMNYQWEKGVDEQSTIDISIPKEM